MNNRTIIILASIILMVIGFIPFYFLFLQKGKIKPITILEQNSIPQNCIQKELQDTEVDISGLLDIPKLFPDFVWEKVKIDEDNKFGEGAIGYLSDGTYVVVDLKGEAWSAHYKYKDSTDYKIDEKFNRYYSEELLRRKWVFKIYVHGLEIYGATADGPTGGIHGVIKIQNGKLRAFVIHERGEYEGEFPYAARLIASTFTIFLSNPVSLSEILPGYKQGAYLGIMHTVITPEIKKTNNLLVDYGVLVNSVIENSPAEIAGVKEGDIILMVNDRRVNQTNPLSNLIKQYCPRDQIILHILSNGTEKEISVMLGEY